MKVDIERMADDFEQSLRETRQRVEQRLDGLLRPRDDCPPMLLDAMRYSVLASGKRLRPLLVILSAEAGGAVEDALPAACAAELVHVYSLIHDDLPAMDDDDFRRGQPTCHKQFGEALAILAGDALLTLAFQVLAESYPAATASGCCRVLARGAGASGMVGGQVEDLAAEQAEDDLDTDKALSVLEGIHTRKTGALFRSCLHLGAWVAQGERPGGPEALMLQRLDAYGRCFGLAFQITDDLLDVEGSLAAVGKRVGKDATRGKLTYPRLWGVDESRQRTQQLCKEARRHIQPLGPAGARLANLVASIQERNR